MSQQADDDLLHGVARQTSQSILVVRQRAEQELVLAKQALEARSEELANSLAIMRATLDSTWDGILVVDERGTMVDFNEQFLKVWGFSRDAVAAAQASELLERAAEQLTSPNVFLERTREIYASAPPDSFDVLKFKDGRVVERYSKLQRVEDRIVGRVWSYHDITERNRAEETLQDEARILELLNKTGAAIAAQLDLQNVVQIVTDAATELTGAKFGSFFYTKTDANGEVFTLYTLSGAPREAFEKFGHPRATPIFGPTFRGEGPIRSDDILKDARYGKMPPHHGMPKGHLPVRSYLAMPVVSSSGEVIGGLFFGHPEPGVFTERSERIIVGVAAQAAIAIDNARLYEAAQKLLVSEKEARERAERETRMKDEFLATLSHELRTPLNAILGWANILRLSTRPEDVADGIAVIERNARAQAQIIEDLLDMSRIISGKVRLDVQRVDLQPVIEAAIESVNPMAAAKEISIVPKFEAGVSSINGDPARLQQVFWNLLTNALKFTPKGGRVTVQLRRVDSHVEISVIDNGHGITPEFLPRVFDRFRQADASTTRQHGGLGLGLAIVKNLVELHGGHVRAESAGENRGATFIVALPVAAVIQEADAETPRVAKESTPFVRKDCPDLTGLTVLAVDDEADARELIKRLLSDCGASVVTAGSGAEALSAMQSRKPDVLVTDIGMPGEDGYAFLSKVRKLSAAEGGAAPAIALTAFARAEDRERAIANGFQMHMAKPVEAADLVKNVAKLGGREGTTLAHPEFEYR